MKKIIKTMLLLSIITFCFPKTSFAETNESKYIISNEFLLLERAYEEYSNVILNSSKPIIIRSMLEDGIITVDEFKNKYHLLESNLDELKDYEKNYKKHIYSMKDLSIEELREFNYSDLQIEAIKNYDGSREMTIAAATTVSVYCDIYNVYKTSAGSGCRVLSTFSINGVLSTIFSDIFVLTISQPLSISYREGHLVYSNGSGTNSLIYPTPWLEGTHAAYLTFPTSTSFGGYQKQIYGGHILVDLTSNAYIADMQAYAAYGHTYLSISPSFSLAPIGGGINFSSGVTKMGYDYDYE